MHITNKMLQKGVFPKLPANLPVVITSLPIYVLFEPQSWEVISKQLDNEWEFTLRPIGLSELHGDEDTDYYVDAYKMRDEFEKVSTPEEAEEFLAVAGPLRDSQRVTWSEFQQWQKIFDAKRRDVDERPSYEEVKKLEESGMSFTGAYRALYEYAPQGETLTKDEESIFEGFALVDIGSDSVARIFCGEALEVVFATLVLDRVSNQEYKACGWCNRLFPVTKDNGKRFCKHDCAQMAGQKRRRAAAKKDTKKTPHSRHKAAKSTNSK